ncbi:hypothetical protein HPB49_025741 [Dermacentor silvarum]|nr:hypothetical protein HPB49_025741 [Dermacentor silvarum]
MYKKMFPDSGVAKNFNGGRAKFPYVISHGLGPYFKSKLVTELCRPTVFFSFMIEETPKPEQHVQQLDLLVRYFSESRQQVVVEHLNSFNLGRATGDIVECRADALAELPRQGLLCVFSDGPNVMKNVKSKLKQKINPNLVDVGERTLHNAFSNGLDSFCSDVEPLVVLLGISESTDHGVQACGQRRFDIDGLQFYTAVEHLSAYLSSDYTVLMAPPTGYNGTSQTKPTPAAALGASTIEAPQHSQPLYKEQQAQLLSRVAGVDVDLAGDGRCDSPGHSAKYGTYVLYCTQVKRILHCQQIQVHESAAVSSSNAMEKEGLARSLQKLDKQGVSINSITTDRHSAIRSYCRKERPGMKHYFDVWHIAKGINKKLSIASKHRNCGSILLWSRSIINHLHFVAAASQGDGDLIVSMWRSLLNHMCNQHNGHEGPFTDCMHGPLDNKKWMTRGSPAFTKLRAILENPRLLSDLRQLSPMVQTFSLESFNSLLIRFAPKSIAYSGPGYVAKLMADVIARAGATSHKTSSKDIPSETRTFLTDRYEAPSMEELIAAHRSRFPDGCP